MMKLLTRLFIVLVVMITVSSLNAQQVKHFIFIQSENKQPYIVQLNNQTYPSTKSGYVTISQLLTGKYFLTVGFPKNQYPDQKFIVDINMNELGVGYSLKLFADKGWGLFNIVDFSVLMADNDAIPVKNDTALASISKNDSVPVTVIINEKEHEKSSAKIDTVALLKTTVINETAAITKTELVAAPAIPVAVASTGKQLSNNKKIIKTFELVSEKSVDQIYIVQGRKKADTIAIFFPLTPKQDTVQTIKRCANLATEDDFHRIRLDMAAATTDEFMLVTAKNYFEKKCYSVSQIKNLGVLFLSEENRLQFFKSALPFLSDEENYASLQSQFTQSEWIEKFKATVKPN